VTQFLVEKGKVPLVRGRQEAEDTTENFAALGVFLFQDVFSDRRETQAHELAIGGVVAAVDPAEPNQAIDEGSGRRRRDVQCGREFLHGHARMLGNKKESVNLERIDGTGTLVLGEHHAAHDASEFPRGVDEPVNRIAIHFEWRMIRVSNYKIAIWTMQLETREFSPGFFAEIWTKWKVRFTTEIIA
jgi:hypothetical protein